MLIDHTMLTQLFVRPPGENKRRNFPPMIYKT